MKPIHLIFGGLVATYAGLAAVNPVLAPLVRELGLSEIQGGLIVTMAALMWSLTGPLWGRRSEVVGRKPVFVIGLFGFAFGFTLFGLSALLGVMGLVSATVAFVLMMLSRGVVGSLFSAVPVSAQAYIADNTSEEERTAGVALIGAANGVGFIGGPAIAAALTTFGLLVPIAFTIVLPLMMGVLALWKLPRARRLTVADKPRIRLKLTDPRFAPMLLVGFLLIMSLVSQQVTAGFFFQDQLALDTRTAAQVLGIALVTSGLTTITAQLLVVQRLKPAPHILLRVGLPIAAIGFILLISARQMPLMVVAFAFTGYGIGLALPGYIASISLSVGSDEQGAVAGLAASAQGFGATFGPITSTALYQLHPLLPYSISAVIVGSIALMVLIRPPLRSAGPAPAPRSLLGPEPTPAHRDYRD
jgi:MFS transporter, DHA1 family, multidrug resistance protein